MSVLDTDVVDIVATRKDSQDVKLVICDHLSWEDFHAHALVIQSKVNAYIAFVERGEWLRTKADMPANPRPVISLDLLHKPPAAAEQFFLDVTKFLRGVGIGFEVNTPRAKS